MIRERTHRRVAVMGLALVVTAVLSGCSTTASETSVTELASATITTVPPTTTTTTTSTTTTTVPPTTTTEGPGESRLFIDFYAMETEGISVSRHGGEILVTEGFDEPPLLRITADDIEAITYSWYGIDLTVSEETILSVRDLGVGVQADRNVFRVTIDETTTWGWLWYPIMSRGTETACILFPIELRDYLPLWPLGAMVGDVYLDVAIKDAWLRSQE